MSMATTLRTLRQLKAAADILEVDGAVIWAEHAPGILESIAEGDAEVIDEVVGDLAVDIMVAGAIAGVIFP